ncbi:MAG: AsmA family protein [Roseomonas sp.]|nr:AsmA family protein [Roseomonas sp.]MCA3379430.1 AsmA family protein [Roseomonas sp.]
MGASKLKSRRSLFALLLTGIALAAVWVGPRLISWEGQRDRLAALASERLSRPVALQGPLRVVLLPQPLIEADEVHLGQDAGGLGVKAQTLRLKLGLAPLLMGQIEARDLVLVGADIRLPWPLPAAGAWRPPPWLSDFAARIEASRVTLGEVTFENVAARLVAPGPLDAVRLEGSFTRAGAEARFQAVLGRPGYDGIGTLELRLNGQGAALLTRGALLAEGGYEGRLEASGAYLSAFLPAPALPFRLSGRLRASEDRIIAPDLAVEFDGGAGRAAAAIQLAPEAKMDLAISMNRLDLDPWIAAMRAARDWPFPIMLDIATESARWQGRELRRFKAGIARDGARMTLTDIAALLPGEAELEARGATLGERLELALSIAGPSLRDSLAAFGIGVSAPDPARLRRFEGRGRLVLEPNLIEAPEFSLLLDGRRYAGAGALRLGARPALGLGLSIDALALDGLLSEGLAWQEAAEALQGFDANLRLVAGKLEWKGQAFDGVALEATLDAGRLSLQRLEARQGSASITASGSVGLGATPSLADAALEITAPMASALPPPLSEALNLPAGLAALPATLRLRGNGTAEALTLATDFLLEDARLEANAVLDLTKARGQGSVTFRHPGAARLFGQVFGREEPGWMGEGSASFIARFMAEGGVITSPLFSLVAAEARLEGEARLELNDARPKLALRIAAENLALPAFDPMDQEPLPLTFLAAFDGALSLNAARIAVSGLPTVENAQAELTLENGRLQLASFRTDLAGGQMEGRGVLDIMAQPPRLEGDIEIAGATIAHPIFDLPLDLAAGRLALAGRLAASGHAQAALLSSMEGSGRFLLADGVLAGLALREAYAAAGLADPAAAEAGLGRALLGGATAVERLEGGWRLSAGRLEVQDMKLAGEGGLSAQVSGAVDLPRRTVDIGFALRPPNAGAPDIGFRFSGPAAAPLRLPDIAPWARWRAEQR